MGEYKVLRENAALVRSRAADWCRLSGTDRLRFANGLVSCDLRFQLPGGGAYGFFTDPRGKIIADAAFLASESDLWIEVPRGQGKPVTEHMSRYVVADQVEIEELPGWETAFVVGPEAGVRLKTALDDLPQPEIWNGSVLETDAGQLLVRADRRFGVPAWALAGSAEALGSILVPQSVVTATSPRRPESRIGR
jgi:folate-binding Fe-S cluster repair protein YgfZ